jgi:hypothetical protein
MSIKLLLQNRKQIYEKILDGCFGVYGFYYECKKCDIGELCQKRTLKMGIRDYRLCWNCYWFGNKHIRYKKCVIGFRGNWIFKNNKRKGNCEIL